MIRTHVPRGLVPLPRLIRSINTYNRFIQSYTTSSNFSNHSPHIAEEEPTKTSSHPEIKRITLKMPGPLNTAESSIQHQDRTKSKSKSKSKSDFQSVEDIFSALYLSNQRHSSTRNKLARNRNIDIIPQPSSPSQVKGIPQQIIPLYYNLKMQPTRRYNRSEFFKVQYFSPQHVISTFRPFNLAATFLYDKSITLNEPNVSKVIKEKFTKSMSVYDYAYNRKKISSIYRSVLFQCYREAQLPAGFYIVLCQKFPTKETWDQFETDVNNMSLNFKRRLDVNERKDIKESNDRIKWNDLEQSLGEWGIQMPRSTIQLRESITKGEDYLRLRPENSPTVQRTEDYKSEYDQYAIPYDQGFIFKRGKGYISKSLQSQQDKTLYLPVKKINFTPYPKQGKFVFNFIHCHEKTILKSFKIWFLHIHSIYEDKEWSCDPLHDFIEQFMKRLKVENLMSLKAGVYDIQIDIDKLNTVVEDEVDVVFQRFLHDYGSLSSGKDIDVKGVDFLNQEQPIIKSRTAQMTADEFDEDSNPRKDKQKELEGNRELKRFLHKQQNELKLIVEKTKQL